MKEEDSRVWGGCHLQDAEVGAVRGSQPSWRLSEGSQLVGPL